MVALVAALCASAGLVGLRFAFAGDDETPGVAAAYATSDPVPTGRTVTSLPQRCGVSKATVTRLVPSARQSRPEGGDDGGECVWTAPRHFGNVFKDNHGLSVYIQLVRGEPANGVTPAKVLADSLPDETGPDEFEHTKRGRVTPVHGLGYEAVSWTVVTKNDLGVGPQWRRFSTLLFRQGNVVTEVTYGGADVRKKRPMPADVAFAGAVRAAKDVTRSMGLRAAAKPALAKPSTEIVQSMPEPCTLVPGATWRRLGFHQPGAAAPSYLLDDETREDSAGCEWSSDDVTDPDKLTVQLSYVADSPLGTGADRAARRYRWLHETSRSTADFHALTRPGQQAFLAYTTGEIRVNNQPTEEQAQVVIRVRNTLVQVTLNRGTWDEDEREVRTDKNGVTTNTFHLAETIASQLDH